MVTKPLSTFVRLASIQPYYQNIFTVQPIVVFH